MALWDQHSAPGLGGLTRLFLFLLGSLNDLFRHAAWDFLRNLSNSMGVVSPSLGHGPQIVGKVGHFRLGDQRP